MFFPFARLCFTSTSSCRPDAEAPADGLTRPNPDLMLDLRGDKPEVLLFKGQQTQLEQRGDLREAWGH